MLACILFVFGHPQISYSSSLAILILHTFRSNSPSYSFVTLVICCQQQASTGNLRFLLILYVLQQELSFSLSKLRRKNSVSVMTETIFQLKESGQKWDEKLERFTEMSNLSAPPKIYLNTFKSSEWKFHRGRKSQIVGALLSIAGALVEYAIILYWKQRNHHR